MAKMYFSTQNCKGVTSGTTGRSYNTDSKGFIHVEDSRDVKALKDGGYVVAGGMPRVQDYFVCDNCKWEAVINHCPKCDSESLRWVKK